MMEDYVPNGNHQQNVGVGPVSHPATAAKSQDESLYQQLLRLHDETDSSDDDSNFQRRRGRKKKSKSPQRNMSIEDSKPAAIPTPINTQRKATPKRSQSRPERSLSPRPPTAPSRENSTEGIVRKPGIVSVDEPAIHPNSAMYRAAYGHGARGTSTPTAATPPRRSPPSSAERLSGDDSFEVAATTAESIGVADLRPPSDNRGRPNSRSSPPNETSVGNRRGRSPKKDGLRAISSHKQTSLRKEPVLDALCVSAHAPLATVQPSPILDPLSASQHNPKFFESIDDTLESAKARSRSPMTGNRRMKRSGDNTRARPKADKSKTKQRSFGDKPVFNDPPRKIPSRTYSDQMKKAKHQSQAHAPLQRPRPPVRSQTAGPNLKSPPSFAAAPQFGSVGSHPAAIAHPKDVPRASSDNDAKMPASIDNNNSNDDFDADLLLALELSRAESQGQSTENAQSSPYAQTPRMNAEQLPPPKGAPDVRPPAKAGQPKSLNDHFSSSFARDAVSQEAQDEGSLADVMLALKLSAEEAAKKEGKSNFYESEIASIREDINPESSAAMKSPLANSMTSATTMELGVDVTDITDAERQGLILQQIREEEEKHELELALKASRSTGSIEDDSDPDFKMALEASRQEANSVRVDSSFAPSSTSEFMLSQQRAMEQFAKNKATTTPTPPPLDHERNRVELLQRGTEETQHAISSGLAHIVTCRKCKSKLQVPTSYALVFCPKCQTVSPSTLAN